uniref:Uncharacterized protein n=1 Tax=Plectus sambesii TaxID=2011161 RepID=A0A914VEN8_9BILA
MSNRRSRSVPKKKAIGKSEEDDRQRRSSNSPQSRKKKTSSLLAAPAEARAKALKERKEREDKRKKQNEHVAKWTGSLREDLHADDRPSFNLDTTIEGYENVDRNGRIRNQRDQRNEWSERQRRKDEQAQLNQSWSNSLRGRFYEED